jgi:hypothetical protein
MNSKNSCYNDVTLCLKIIYLNLNREPIQKEAELKLTNLFHVFRCQQKLGYSKNLPPAMEKQFITMLTIAGH